VSHNATCEADGHTDAELGLEDSQHTATGGQSTADRVPSVLDPAPARIAARAGRITSFLGLPEVRWAALSLACFLLALLTGALGAPGPVQGVLFTACYLTGGWKPTLAGLQALRGRSLDVDLLMIVAALAAAAIGQPLDGALLVVIFSTSGALEAVATKRTQDSVRSLLTLAPERATRLRPNGGEEVVDTATLVPGDRVLVRPGERIGADGHVVDGASDVDQASITGEPLSVTKTPGTEVFAGTVNGTGALVVAVSRAAADSVVATQVPEAPRWDTLEVRGPVEATTAAGGLGSSTGRRCRPEDPQPPHVDAAASRARVASATPEEPVDAKIVEDDLVDKIAAELAGR
jgi:cation transport ATPase